MSKLTTDEIEEIVIALDERIGDEFHDVIARTLSNSDGFKNRSDDWEVSDEDVYTIKMELAMDYLMEYRQFKNEPEN